ncbi:MAG: hypothetical protein ACOCWQ_06295 [Nanoarchaeota archaeon]
MLPSIKKKASLNLSINAIVIVVLAFVMLGLGLTLTRSVLNQALDTSLQIGDSTKDQIMDILREGNKKIAFPGKEVKVESGDQEVIAIGVKNTLDRTLEYKIDIEVIATALADGTTTEEPAPVDYGQGKGQFFWPKISKELDAGSSDVIAIKYTAEKSKGSYLYRISLIDQDAEDDDNDVYAATEFYVTVQ